MILTDSHLHTYFSADSETPVAAMVEQGIRLGLKSLCFTDHMDLDFPDKYPDFTFDTGKYWQEMQEVQARYRGQIDIRIGIELGLQPQLKAAYDALLQEYPYDFVIGSTHLLGNWDPYYREEHPEYQAEEVIRMYFEQILDNLRANQNVHAAGHLDYVVRYVAGQFAGYDCRLYQDQTDAILRLLIEAGIALEINTSGWRYDHGHQHPHRDICRRYRELGGELLTIGSDAHIPAHIGIGFTETRAMLQAAGFERYVVFQKGKPEFRPL